MPLPNLIHPTLVIIERLSPETTIYDPDFDEPVQNADRSERFSVSGQVRWGMDKNSRPQPGGPEEGSDGYILFRMVDLRAAGLDDVNRGDRFITIGTGPNSRAVDLYVTGIRPEGHYPDQGGPALVKAFFRDRQPVQQNRGGV